MVIIESREPRELKRVYHFTAERGARHGGPELFVKGKCATFYDHTESGQAASPPLAQLDFTSCP